jgi:uncharacterized membrane protein YeaQ/YmgE (transglycosylase-associated protein family)
MMLEGLTWLWTIVVGGIAGTLTDLFVKGAKQSVYGGFVSGSVGDFLSGLILVSIIGGMAAVFLYCTAIKQELPLCLQPHLCPSS